MATKEHGHEGDVSKPVHGQQTIERPRSLGPTIYIEKTHTTLTLLR